jgi:hypothetical protein
MSPPAGCEQVGAVAVGVVEQGFTPPRATCRLSVLVVSLGGHGVSPDRPMPGDRPMISVKVLL